MVNQPPAYQPPGEKDLVIKSLHKDIERLRKQLEEIEQIAEDQLGDWRGVDPVYQPAAIHHWQEIYDLAGTER